LTHKALPFRHANFDFTNTKQPCSEWIANVSIHTFGAKRTSVRAVRGRQQHLRSQPTSRGAGDEEHYAIHHQLKLKVNEQDSEQPPTYVDLGKAVRDSSTSW